MPTRDKKHQLEDVSRAKFQLVLPENWVCRDKDKDYGIDIEVEIFDENGGSTGLVFWGQLKATSSGDDYKKKNVSIKVETISYYMSLEIPVLIIRYSAEKNEFYVKWASEIDLYYAKAGAESITVNFNDDEKWQASTPEHLKSFLEKIRNIKNMGITFPVPFHIKIEDELVNGISKAVLSADIRSFLRNFSDLIVIEQDRSKAIVEVTITKNDLVVNFASIKSCTFHKISKYNKDKFAEDLAANMLMGLAVNFLSLGRREDAGRVLLDERIREHVLRDSNFFANMIPAILSTSHYGEMLDATCSIIPTEKDNIIEIITSASGAKYLDFNNSEMKKKYKNFLTTCLDKYEKIGEPLLIAVSLYNLGKFLSSSKEYTESIRCYFKARRFDKGYTARSYYFHELGASFFNMGKYLFSAKMYKKCHDIDGDISVIPFYADALMRSGKYQKALKFHKIALDDKATKQSVSWHLMEICLESLIDHTGIKEQARKPDAALSTLETLNPDEENFAEKLDQALNEDMLSKEILFNLGVANSKIKDMQGATICFSMAALLGDSDIISWVNAALSSFNKEMPPEIFSLIIQAAYEANGDDFLASLYKEVEKQLDLPLAKKLIEAIEEFLPKDNNQQDLPIIRMVGDDGEYTVLSESKT